MPWFLPYSFAVKGMLFLLTCTYLSVVGRTKALFSWRIFLENGTVALSLLFDN